MPIKDIFKELISSCEKKSNNIIDLYTCLEQSCEDVSSLYRSKFPIDLSQSDIRNLCLEELSIYKLSSQTSELDIIKCKYCRSNVNPPDEGFSEECHIECKHVMEIEGKKIYDMKLEKFKNYFKEFPQFNIPNILIATDKYEYPEMINSYQFILDIDPIDWNSLNIERVYNQIDSGLPVSLHASDDLLELLNGDGIDSGHIVTHRVYNLARKKMNYHSFLDKIIGDLPLSAKNAFNQEYYYYFDKTRFIKDRLMGNNEKVSVSDVFDLSNAETLKIEELSRSTFNIYRSQDNLYTIDELVPYINIPRSTRRILNMVIEYEDISDQQKIDWLNYVANDFKKNDEFPFFKKIDDEFVFASIPNIW